ncbi:hypothetical protein [Mesorhizobium sp. M7A.F.Ca.CA.004.02.1.1]|uniref:hypothetical protein n=1 Tax=Mesorhizobium sp. M7A.F.Ca.CA.004.02.1.1 TaxID=2496690 RepID=UPI000FCA4B59|nr:hypothetical protein [Mesorhizobium sp. M7A.F.Ca.CA.004.02.1.1]RVB05672.1 hypothetical protein EN912_02095 [Mesorhizobium sp. M7A.F.Ca.CA.004.02.1.1]
MKTTTGMNDDQRKAAWLRVTDPREALEEMVAHACFIGSDPYYRDLDTALWAMADRALEGQPA